MQNGKKIILDLCGGTGSWSKPYKDAGYQVINLTLPQYDVTKADLHNKELLLFAAADPLENLHVPIKDIHGILAAPPCTEFSLAKGNRPRDFEKGMSVVRACLQIIWHVRTHGKLKFWALENPVGFLRQFIGQPALTFEPWHYGAGHSKRTDLWGYFEKPVRLYTEPPLWLTGSSIKYKYKSRHYRNASDPVCPKEYESQLAGLPWKQRRAAIRAITPPHFAAAFYKANP